MILRYASYPFDADTTLLQTYIRTVFNRASEPLYQVRTFTIQGFLSGSGQADLTQKENALKAALSVHGGDLVFLRDDGGQTSEILLSSTARVPVRITDGPHFGTTSGPEYATLRSFSFTAEAEYDFPRSGLLLVDFQERLTFSGGGPLFAHQPAIAGPPVKVRLYQQTPYVLVQQGQAVGYGAYPQPAAPVAPAALKMAPAIDRAGPRRVAHGRYREFPVSWSYTFESAAPLAGVPSLWIS